MEVPASDLVISDLEVCGNSTPTIQGSAFLHDTKSKITGAPSFWNGSFQRS